MASFWSNRREQDNSRLVIERAHDELLAGNVDDVRLAHVRPLVRDSWQRSLSQFVGAEGLPRLELSGALLEDYRRAHPLAGAIEMIRALLLPGDPEDAGVVVAVGDAAGRLLWVEGDASVRALTGDMGFVEGANWSEDVVGTSAPGTAIALDRSVQIRGAEHFNRLVQPWSCTAAPVHDPVTRRLIGVIDVTGGEHVVTSQAQMLVDATARAVEGELLLARLRQDPPEAPARRATRRPVTTRATLRVLGRERAQLEVTGDMSETVTEVGRRHAELLLVLAGHPKGLSAERLGELVYGDTDSAVTLRAELVRLRKMLARTAPHVQLESRPYRLNVPVETDAQQVLSLLDRGAHRVALAAYRGDVLPESIAPGVEELRANVKASLRGSLMSEASVDVLLSYAETDAGADDEELLRLCLSMLPARSPKRAGLVARIERLDD